MNKLGMCMAAGVLALAPAFAQTGGSSNQTCNVAPTGVNALTIERSLSATMIGTTQNFTANIDPAILAQIAAGNLEIREQFTLDTSNNVLSSSLFAVGPTSSMPTNVNSLPAGPQRLGGYTVKVDRTYFSCSPVPNVLMVGTIASTGSSNVFGSNLTGAPVAVSFGYTTANPPQINNVVVVIAGVVEGYSPSGAGTLTLVNPPVVPPPGTNPGGPVIVVGGGFDQVTSARQVTLSAIGTTDPGGTQVSYVWTQPQPGSNVPGCEDPTKQCTLQAAIKDQNTPTPTITFSSGKGYYLFVLTATNATGQSTTQVIRIQYIGII